MEPGPRADGFVPIGDYAVLGDGRSVALVASDGRVDWWPIPALDSPPACAAVLDPDDGGFLALAPAAPYEVGRGYLPGTNVLETTFTTEHGSCRVLDALNRGAFGLLPWTELARRIEGVDGAIELRWRFQPGDRFGTARPWVSGHGAVPMVMLGDQTIALVLEADDELELAPGHVGGCFRLSAGKRALLAAVAADHEPVYVPTPQAVHDRLERTVEDWRRWSARIAYEGPFNEAVVRSALALRLLFCEPTGAIAAAATTSLPESIGGEKNWDYRYGWVRDASFTLDALIRLGLQEEVQASTSWLIGALRESAPELHVFYTLGGKVAEQERCLDAPGYRQSRPVRSGNSAAGQTQLGTYGDLFDTIRRYVDDGHYLDESAGRLLADLADRCCDGWMAKDSGIWELDQLEHYTISKIGCWVALDRAASLAADGQLPTRHADRWQREAQAIRRFVEERCWSEAKSAYGFYAGTDKLDAAVLLAGRTGFDRGPRLSSTIEAVIAELGDGPLLYRYSGMAAEEGAFVACSFWLVDALVWTGQAERAAALMKEAVALGNDLGLLSEQVDPKRRQLLGNLPQGLSHLALINAAHALEDAAS